MANFDQFTSELYQEHNRLRNDPQSYIPIIEKELTQLRDKILYRPGETPLQLSEGKSSYEDAINFLKQQYAVPELKVNGHLETAAQSHAKDAGINGLLSHEGSDSRNVSDRVEDFCEWNEALGENIDFGSKSAQQVLVSLLTDDGVYSRPHRQHIFNPAYKHFGAGIDKHRDHETVVVIDYAGDIREKGTAFYDYDNYRYEYPEPKERLIKNAFQENDPDAPDETVAIRLEKSTKFYKGRAVKVTKKCYTLKNGTQHIVEVEDI
jgi:uncharacterized protein YkwD